MKPDAQGTKVMGNLRQTISELLHAGSNCNSMFKYEAEVHVNRTNKYNKYTKILEVNLSAFAYRLFHEDFSPVDWAKQSTSPVDWREIFMK